MFLAAAIYHIIFLPTSSLLRCVRVCHSCTHLKKCKYPILQRTHRTKCKYPMLQRAIRLRAIRVRAIRARAIRVRTLKVRAIRVHSLHHIFADIQSPLAICSRAYE